MIESSDGDSPEAIALDDTRADPSSDATLDATTQPAGGSPSTIDLPPAMRGRYEVGVEIGRGGLGRVMRARDVHLGRYVAIKELHARGGDAKRRFVREALITARLEHPGIVTVHEAGKWPDGSPFYAMKLVRGQPLSKEVEPLADLDARIGLVPALLAVADAMAYAHSLGVVHRDLKPHNILIGDFGETVVIDWGLAKDLRAAVDDLDARVATPGFSPASDDRTVAGTVIGTPAYMPPEQADGKPVDERADVYSLGAVMYHVLSGKPPHTGSDLGVVLSDVIAGKLVPLVEREPSVPRDLAAIVTKAMARDPAARYRDAGALADDLRRFQTGQLVGAHHYTWSQRARRWLRRHRAIAAASAVAVAVAVVAAWWILAARATAVSERDRALDAANRATLAQASSALARDPAQALAWLAQLSPDGPGWDSARVLAADALWHQPAQRILAGHRARPHQIVVDGDRAITWDAVDLWLWDLRDPSAAGRSFAIDQIGFASPCDDRRWIAGHEASPTGAQIEFAVDLETAAIWRETDGTPDPLPRCRASDTGDNGMIRMKRPGEARRLGRDDPRGRYVIEKRDTHIELQDASTLERRRAMDFDGDLEDFAFSPDGRWIAAYGTREAWMWNLDDGGGVKLAVPGIVVAGAFLPDSRFATLGDDRTLRIWAPVTYRRSFGASITAAASDAGGLVIGTRSGEVMRVATDNTPSTIVQLGPTGAIEAIASQRGRLAVALGREVYAIDGGGAAVRLGDHPDARLDRPDAGRLAVGWIDDGVASWDGESLRLWIGGESHLVALPAEPEPPPRADPVANTQVRPISWCGTHVASLAVDPGGRRLAISRADIGACDGVVIVVDVATRTARVAHDARGRAPRFSSDGARLATGAIDGAVLIWDLAAHVPRRIAAGITEPEAIVFSPDDKHVAITGEDGVAIVDVRAGTARRIAVEGDTLRAAWFSPDAAMLYVDAQRGRLRAWSVATGTPRELGIAGALALEVGAERLRVVTGDSLWTVPDDLPRSPHALSAYLRRLPYRLPAQ